VITAVTLTMDERSLGIYLLDSDDHNTVTDFVAKK